MWVISFHSVKTSIVNTYIVDESKLSDEMKQKIIDFDRKEFSRFLLICPNISTIDTFVRITDANKISRDITNKSKQILFYVS